MSRRPLHPANRSNEDSNRSVMTITSSKKQPVIFSAWEVYQQQRTAVLRAPLCLLRDATEPWLEIPRRGIHELVGEAGAGKTQLALQLCVSVAVSSSNNTALYLSLKHGNLNKVLQRLQQLNANVLGQILTKSIHTTDDLHTTIATDLPLLLLENPNLRLVVIDSIADLFRSNEELSYPERAKQLFRLAQTLQKLSEMHQIAILTLNQMSADQPSLGMVWSYCVSSRYRLFRMGETTTALRTLTLIKSARYALPASITFIIQTNGVFATTNK